MDYKWLNKAFALLTFLVASVVYLMTVQPSVPFWDCGEFTSAAIWQQVPHPPGTPLFLLIGNVFHTLIPFGDPAWRVNVAAVFSTAVAAMLVYLIIVKIIENYRKDKLDNLGDAIAVYGSALIGAGAFIFSDTIWFNAVESEVYATSNFFVALVIWIMMKWNEDADNPGHERWLLLIAFVIGLSIGVHLLSILTVFSIVMLVYFRKYGGSFNNTSFFIAAASVFIIVLSYLFIHKIFAVLVVASILGYAYFKKDSRKNLSFTVTSIIAVGVFFIIQQVIIMWLPAFLAGHTSGRNAAREYAIEDSTLLIFVAIGIIAVALFGLYWGIKHNKHLLKLSSLAFLFIIMGYSTYTQILLRSNANPPMNENAPDDLSSLTAYLGREQYGDAPVWPRRYQTDDYFIQNYRKTDNRGNFVYGEWYQPNSKPITSKDGQTFSEALWDRVNVTGEFTYMWKYQINHMYWRYFGWNFIGRHSDVQDAGVALFGLNPNEELNYKNGYADQFPIRFFALPFLFGLLGLLFHFYRDPKMAFTFLIMFLLTGVLMALAQNQQEPQPRERDYFYAVSFMIWAFWIGMGTLGLIEFIKERKVAPAIAAAIIFVSIFLVPVNMAVGGWKIHNRSGNFLPFDYSYNILQSTEHNAIIFTNGDNDTFPLWYIQDVAGVRRDVRVVNLSLGNTLWYVDQLKNREPWGAEKIPLTFSDESLRVDERDINALTYDFSEPREIAIPVRREILEKYTNDPAILADGNMRFTFEGKPFRVMEDGRNIHLIRVQDKLILDILQQVRFERPVYFSNTVGPDAFSGLDGHFRIEGMAMRICPVVIDNNSKAALDVDIMEASLMNYDNSENFSLEPKYGFKFRNLNNQRVYYDEVHRRLMSTYRSLFVSYAHFMLVHHQDSTKTIEILDKMNEVISVEQFPMSFDMEFRVAQIYNETGSEERTRQYAELCLKSCMELINNPNLRPDLDYSEARGRFAGPYRSAGMLYQMLDEYDKAIDIYRRLIALIESYQLAIQNDPSRAEDLQRMEFNRYDLMTTIDEIEIARIEKEQGIEAAMEAAMKLLTEYEQSDDQTQRMMARYIQETLRDLDRKLNPQDYEDSSNLDMFMQ